MKKLSMALLVALLSAGFVSACSDDKKDDDPKTATDACAEVKCDAIANANGVAKGDNCVCEYTCKSGFDRVDGDDGAFTCEQHQDACAGVTCNAIANADGVAKGDDCACEYTCKDGFDKVDGTDGAFTCEQHQDACAGVTCNAIANADGVAKGDDCACEYTCKDGFDKVDGTDGAFTCEPPKGDCSKVTCDAIANATGVAKGDDCTCEYKCNDNAEKVDDPTAAGSFKCLLKNGEVCNGNDECVSNNCATVDDETSQCAAAEDPGHEEGVACNPADDNPCTNADALCINNVCKTADDLNYKECSEMDSDYCFGNVKVSCEEGSWGFMYTKDTCADGCVLNGKIASCNGGEDYSD